jgi:hypothetical protein
MIKYQLICKNCELTFDSWFASSREFEKLKNKDLLNCHKCNSKKIEKNLMAPKLINKSNLKDFKMEDKKFKEVKKTIKEYQKFIKNNFDYVGENFAHEARAIHYKEKKNLKGIYGTATLEDFKELKEEGIDSELIPWLKDNTN